MITVRQKKIVIENTDKNILYYPDLFSGPIIAEIAEKLDNRSLSSLSVGLAMVTGKIYKPRYMQSQPGSLACVALKEEKAVFEKVSEKIEVDCQPGAVFILGTEFRKNWEYNLPLTSIKLYEENYLPGIYLSAKQRFLYAEKIRKSLESIRKLPVWKQCLQKNMALELIGKGSYGNVFKTGYSSQVFAIKMSKLKPESLENPYDISFSSWHEVFFLKDILRPLIEKNICPNFPLIYDTFTCDSCELIIDDEKINTPCAIIAMELAEGNLKHYLQEKRTVEELYSALFQIMAAVHAIQHYAQIMNFDVKKENVLVYDVEPGGYWEYKIKGQTYYVPNFGKLFILNDFGISRPMSPKYPIYKTKDDKTFRLGSRYAVIKDGKFLPFDTMAQIDENGIVEKSHKIEWEDGKVSLGAEFRMNRKDNLIMDLPVKLTEEMVNFLEQEGITTKTKSYKFFSNPEVIPPFEFYNDTQDVIRMFTGGKRTTQKGNHKAYPSVPKKFIKELAPYLGKGESSKDHMFSLDPAEVLAGYFIQSFFSAYRVKPEKTKIIAIYTVS
jgi:serine/threonine protein kinase